MRIAFLVAFIHCVLSISAQSDLQARYPFMHMEENRIQVLGDDYKIERFFEKLDRLAFEGEGNISVLHMGGSHVQAGTLSQAMREGMHAMSPGLKGNRGLFFPFRLAHTNEPRNFAISSSGDWDGFRCSVNSHEARWGMSGIVATTTDKNARTTIVAFDGDTARYRFSTVRIYHPGGGEYYHPIIDSARYDVDTIFFDERGFTEFRFFGTYEQFQFNLDGPDTANRFIWQGVEYVNDWPGMSYHAIGVNGASTKSYLRCEDFAPQVTAIAPDLVVFGIGINDAYMSQDRFEPEVFKARYDSLMDMLEAANPEVVFLFLTNNDSYYRRRYPNPNALEVQRVMRELTEERDGIYWDLFEVMGGLGSVDLWVDRGLAKSDRIHMTSDGYKLQAELLTHAFEQAWLNHLEDRAR